MVEDCAQLTKANSIEGTWNFKFGCGQGLLKLLLGFPFHDTTFVSLKSFSRRNFVRWHGYIQLSGYKALNSDAFWLVGNKRDNVTVIYTPWSNLKKDGGMAIGQVGFHNQKRVSQDRYMDDLLSLCFHGLLLQYLL